MSTAISFINERLLRIRSLPRWFVFLFDLTCSSLALWTAFVLRFNFDLLQISRYPVYELIGITLIINALFFYVFRVYAGIIRQTSIEDARRVLAALSCCVAVLFCWNVFAKIINWEVSIPGSVLMIYFFTSTLILFGYRLGVKVVYELLQRGFMHHTNVVILGANESGLITLNALHKYKKERTGGDLLNVVGFLDSNPQLWKKQLQGIRIYPVSIKVLENLYKRERVRQLIISEDIASKEERNYVIEWCLKKRVKVRHIPPMNEWIQDGLQVKRIRDIHIEDLLDREEIDIHNELIEDQIKGKVLLITGAAGSIGSELVRQVGKYTPSKLLLCDQAESPLHELWLEARHKFPEIEVVCYLADVRNRQQMKWLFRKHSPQWVLHAAAYKHVPMMERCPELAVLNNVLGTIHLSELSVEHQVEKFVMISTDKAVNPTNVMGATKRLAEIFAQSLHTYLKENVLSGNGENGNGTVQNQTAFITTRFGNVLGSNGSVVPYFTRQINEGGPVTVTHPEVVRYFMTIPEACQLVLEAAIMGKGGEIFAFDMGMPVKIDDLARKMVQLAGLVPDKDIRIVYTGLRPGEKLYEELLSNEENTLPTHHQKIMIAKVREYPFTEVRDQFNNLIQVAEEGRSWEVVRLMKTIIPEFKSNNSVFEKLDKGVQEMGEMKEEIEFPDTSHLAHHEQ